MLREKELEDSIKFLQQGELEDVALVLQLRSGDPLEDPRILPYIEQYLEDTRLCRFGIPFEYGEVRWLAADALAAERGMLGIGEPVLLKGVAKPLGQKQVYALLDKVEPSWKNDQKGSLAWLETLKSTGKLPTYDKIFPPKKRFASK